MRTVELNVADMRIGDEYAYRSERAVKTGVVQAIEYAGRRDRSRVIVSVKVPGRKDPHRVVHNVCGTYEAPVLVTAEVNA